MLELLLTLNILSAIWLMTDLIGAACWKKRPDWFGTPEQMATTAQALVRSDLIFTAPGIVGLLATGIWMVGLTGWRRFEEPWLVLQPQNSQQVPAASRIYPYSHRPTASQQT